MAREPIAGQPRNFLERAFFFEKMRGAGNNFEALFRLKVLERLAIHADDWNVQAADDEQRRGFYGSEHWDRQVWPSAPGDYRAHIVRALGGGNQSRCGSGARAEIAYPQMRRGWIFHEPVGCASNAAREHLDIEAQPAGAIVFALFSRGQQIDQQRRQATLAKGLRDVSVAGTVAAAAAAVRKQNHAARALRHCQVAFEFG